MKKRKILSSALATALAVLIVLSTFTAAGLTAEAKDAFGGIADFFGGAFADLREKLTDSNDYPDPVPKTQIGDSSTYWEYADGVLTISGEGAMPDFDLDDWVFQPWYDIQDQIQSVVISEGVTAVGDDAFSYCSSLASVTFPEGLTTIGDYAFYECTSLASVTFPEGLTSIGDSAFYSCTSLESVTFPEGLTSIGNWAFVFCDSLASVTFPEGLTSIGNYAFFSCSSLASVSFPEGLTSIGNYAFEYCDSLASVSFPEGLTSIGYRAFAYCDSLASVTFPEGLTSIGNWAFYNCDSLASVTCWAKVPPSCGAYAFDSCSPNLKIYVPEESIDAYKQSWSDYADRIYVIKDSYLSIDINNVGSSYYVGDEIRFFIQNIDITYKQIIEGSFPQGVSVVIDDASIISLKKVNKYDDFAEYIFVADKTGLVSISISDERFPDPIRVVLHITEDQYKSYRADQLPSHEYNLVDLEKDYYNIYLNGMYIADFSCKIKDENTYTFDFKVYNEKYVPGVVEVYNANGELVKIEVISKFKDISSLKEVIYGGIDMVVDVWNRDTFSFRGVTNSKETPVHIDVPKDGYVIITNSPVSSTSCFLVNVIDFFLTAGSFLEGLAKFDTEQIDYITKETIMKYISITHSGLEEYGGAIIPTIQKEFFEEYVNSISKADNVVPALFGLVTDVTKSLFDVVNLDFEEILKNVGQEYFYSEIKSLLVKGGGPAGIALAAIFLVSKGLNLFQQNRDLARNADFVSSIGIFAPTTIDRKMREITSKDNITVTSEEPFDKEIILQTYRIENHTETDDDFSDAEKYTLYNISLQKTGEEIQPDNPVTVFIPIPNGYSSVQVYKQDENGNWVIIESTVFNGAIQFQVDHFCLFAIVDEINHEHSYVAVVTKPTCTEQGYTTHTCSCGDSYVDTYVSPLGHSYTKYISDGNATCTKDGTKTAKCDRCTATDTVTDTGSARGHDFVVDHVVEPTETEKGYTLYKCSRCDATEKRDWTDPVKPVYEKGDVNGDGEVTITDYLMIKAHVLGTKEFDAEIVARMNVNGDKDDKGKDVINIADYLLVKKFVLEK